MTLASVAKFVIGVSFAIALMIGGSVVVGLYFMYKVTTHPPKPVFSNEKVNQTAAKVKNLKNPPQVTTEPSPSETNTAKLAPGTYKARVNWLQGLSLRAEPNVDAERIGGLDNNQRIVVIEESADKNWQKVRLADGAEGWIRAGNIERHE
jgi:hypothetical protein